MYTANLASQLKSFDRYLYETLVLSYGMYEESMILTAICTLLIKGSCMENCFFKWYEKAVESELKDCTAVRVLYGCDPAWQSQ